MDYPGVLIFECPSTVYVLNDTHRFDKTNLSLRQVVAKFLNQVHAGLWPAHAWFLKIAFVWEVDMRVFVCLLPRLLITVQLK